MSAVTLEVKPALMDLSGSVLVANTANAASLKRELREWASDFERKNGHGLPLPVCTPV